MAEYDPEMYRLILALMQAQRGDDDLIARAQGYQDLVGAQQGRIGAGQPPISGLRQPLPPHPQPQSTSQALSGVQMPPDQRGYATMMSDLIEKQKARIAAGLPPLQ